MLYAIVAIILLIFDQALKLWTTNNIVFQVGEKTLIPGVLGLSNWRNYGAAFGFLQNYGWLFVILCIAFCAVIIYLMYKKVINGRFAKWAAIITMAGAVGNAIDRLINGYVVDMLEFLFYIPFIETFPIFNLADCFITIGGIAFCVCILFEKNSLQSVASASGGKGKALKPSTRKTKTNVDPFATWEASDSSQADYASPLPESNVRSAQAEPPQANHRLDSTPQQKNPTQPARQPKSPTRPAESELGNQENENEFDINSILDEFREQ